MGLTPIPRVAAQKVVLDTPLERVREAYARGEIAPEDLEQKIDEALEEQAELVFGDPWA